MVTIERELDYKEFYWEESNGNFGIKILVAGRIDGEPTSKEYQAAYEAIELIKSACMRELLLSNPATAEFKKSERDSLLKCFPDGMAIFVEELPNGYCKRYCCSERPWYQVTTRVGRFKIGWRKRVIAIAWDETVGTASTTDLFPKENVTKGHKDIHAWSYEDATRYIAAIIASAGAVPGGN